MDAKLAIAKITRDTYLQKQVSDGLIAVIEKFPKIEKLEDFTNLEEMTLEHIIYNGNGRINEIEIRMCLNNLLKTLGYGEDKHKISFSDGVIFTEKERRVRL